MCYTQIQIGTPYARHIIQVRCMQHSLYITGTSEAKHKTFTYFSCNTHNFCGTSYAKHIFTSVLRMRNPFSNGSTIQEATSVHLQLYPVEQLVCYNWNARPLFPKIPYRNTETVL